MTTQITKGEMDQYVLSNVTIEKQCSTKADGDSDVGKKVNLRVKFDNVTVADLAWATFGQGVVVKWQSSNRKRLGQYKDGQTVDITFSAPGRAPMIDPVKATLDMAASWTPEEMQAYIDKLNSLRKQ